MSKAPRNRTASAKKKTAARKTARRAPGARKPAGAGPKVSFGQFNRALASLQTQLAAAARRKPGDRSIAKLRTSLQQVQGLTRCEKAMTVTF